MERIIYGSDYNSGKTCALGDRQPGICDIFPGLISLNGTVEVTYSDGGLGYSGRSAGAVPVISLTISDLQLRLPVFGSLMSMTGLTFPAFTISATAEDMHETS